MSEIFDLVKVLREKTGAGFVDCKIALEKNSNDIDNAIIYLRKKGTLKVVKKSIRETKEGVVCINISKNFSSILEINTETDFVAKNSDFLNFVKKINSLSVNCSSINNLFETKYDDRSTVNEILTDLISKIGENIVIRNLYKISSDNNSKIFGYVHNKYDDNIGKIACLLKIQAENFNDELNELAKNICMHIAALKPIAISISDLDDELIKKEKLILSENIKSSGKSHEIVEKILEGKIKKFYEEVVLLEQKYIIDNETKIKDLLDNYSNNSKMKININEFKLLVLGN